MYIFVHQSKKQPHPADFYPLSRSSFMLCFLTDFNNGKIMPKKRYRPEDILSKLREADFFISHGKTAVETIPVLGH